MEPRVQPHPGPAAHSSRAQPLDVSVGRRKAAVRQTASLLPACLPPQPAKFSFFIQVRGRPSVFTSDTCTGSHQFPPAVDTAARWRLQRLLIGPGESGPSVCLDLAEAAFCRSTPVDNQLYVYTSLAD